MLAASRQARSRRGSRCALASVGCPCPTPFPLTGKRRGAGTTQLSVPESPLTLLVRYEGARGPTGGVDLELVRSGSGLAWSAILRAHAASPRAASRALGAWTEFAGGRTQLGASATNGHGGHLRGHTASMIMAASPACSDALERSDGVCGSDCVFFPLLSLSLVFSDLYNSTVFFLFCFAFRRPLRARSVGRRPGTCCRCCARP